LRHILNWFYFTSFYEFDNGALVGSIDSSSIWSFSTFEQLSLACVLFPAMISNNEWSVPLNKKDDFDKEVTQHSLYIACKMSEVNWGNAFKFMGHLAFACCSSRLRVHPIFSEEEDLEQYVRKKHFQKVLYHRRVIESWHLRIRF
jgi:hypothetical protein